MFDVKHFKKELVAMCNVSNPSASLATAQIESEVTIDTFRSAMRELAGGVAVVTVGREADRTGFTATSVSSLSAEPPRLLVCVNQESCSWEVLEKSPFFGVNILRAEHQGLADQFAGRGGLRGLERYRGASWMKLSENGAEILDDAVAGIDCVVEEILQLHAHAIVVGRIKAIRVHTEGQPLVYWQGAYRQIAP
jgi:flavin reductase (DIM6/NTAB) family NADH-FMN oxidoreductase RutF